MIEQKTFTGFSNADMELIEAGELVASVQGVSYAAHEGMIILKEIADAFTNGGHAKLCIRFIDDNDKLCRITLFGVKLDEPIDTFESVSFTYVEELDER